MAFPSLPEPFTHSAARPEDLQEVVALVGAARSCFTGKPEVALDEMREAWATLDLETESVVVRHPDAGIVAYADLDNRADVLISVYGDVHPEWRGLGLGSWLVGWGEASAEERFRHGNQELRACLRHYLPERDVAGRSLLDASGYRQVRRVDVLQIDLPAAPMSRPPIPACIEIAQFRPGVDERAAFEAMEEAFRDLWGRPPGTYERFLESVAAPGADAGLMLMAWDGEEVAGQAWGAVQDGEGWVHAVGVRRNWRRRGIATELLRLLFEAFAARGVPRAALSVDAESSSRASDVYLAAGMELARSYAVMEKTIREGSDFAVQGS